MSYSLLSSTMKQIIVVFSGFLLYYLAMMGSPKANSRAWRAGCLPRGIQGRTHPPKFDALTAHAHELQQLINAGSLRSVDLVEEYVWRTEKYNPYLRAISEYAPEVLARAHELDRLRDHEKVLSPLHGIPVLIKNTINTHPDLGMGTTASTFAFIGNEPARNADVVDKLIAAGAVIISKTSVSELSYWKGSGLVCGWSALDGQGQSPYVRGGVDPTDSFGGHSVPGGSSSGVCNGLSAGLGALGVGAETEGSITAPAIRASLYSMRPTMGSISSAGFMPVSHSFDTPAIVAKDPRDLADLLTVVVDPEKGDVPSGGYICGTSNDWDSVRIGTLDPEVWNFPEFLVKPVPEATEQIVRATEDAYSRIKEVAGKYEHHMGLPNPSKFVFKGSHSVYDIIGADFRNDLNVYLQDLSKSSVRNVQELVNWNLEHKDLALPPGATAQDLLVAATEEPKFSDTELQVIREHVMSTASKFDEIRKELGIDIIIAPGDSWLTQYATANGYPLAAVPLDYLDYNGRAIGLQAMAGANEEQMLLKFLGAYDDSFKPRKPPAAFEKWPVGRGR